ncbi:mannose-1-phosphate guanylyltransferase [Allopontixanthobacter sp.]|uniref:mannose-1-phosphate guanylyltransferase n=1 Tax=Allopontixanthobacter sp. TaxID=2906452 RepID=UPI002AB81901|nr:mannose-1-phosphate guanylyltransferase [Allopontixanthobacter sp.]MDZ4307293.1 mannose-1-phosphate guanylyltransferase [Allopontixanthobacter sp.]
MPVITPIILCGGSGTRLWPRSRAVKPKPFLPLVGEATLFEATLARCADPAVFAPPIVVTGRDHLEHVTAQSQVAAGLQIIVEPAARNTAPAVALAAARLPAEAIMLVCPSDHYIGDRAAFIGAAQSAAALAADGWMVAFGIEAVSPETGFGYILRGTAIDHGGYRIERFVEKPDRDRAAQFLADGGYSWNGGIFAFRAGDYLTELERYRPEMARLVRKSVSEGVQDGAQFYPDADAFAAIERESVDYAVMENTSRAAVIPADMGWSDIGNWTALHEARSRDAAGNSVTGKAELIDCSNVMVETDGPRVSIIGLQDVVVVVDGNEVLIVSAAGAQQVGKLNGAENQ